MAISMDTYVICLESLPRSNYDAPHRFTRSDMFCVHCCDQVFEIGKGHVRIHPLALVIFLASVGIIMEFLKQRYEGEC